MNEIIKECRRLKAGDVIQLFNGDLQKPDSNFPRNYPISLEILGIDGYGQSTLFKTSKGWTRGFNRLKRFTVEIPEDNSAFNVVPTIQRNTEKFKGLSIE